MTLLNKIYDTSTVIVPGVICATITNPMWVVIVRMRTQGKEGKSTADKRYYKNLFGKAILNDLQAQPRQRFWKNYTSSTHLFEDWFYM